MTAQAGAAPGLIGIPLLGTLSFYQKQKAHESQSLKHGRGNGKQILENQVPKRAHQTKDIWVSTTPDRGSRLGLLLFGGM